MKSAAKFRYSARTDVRAKEALYQQEYRTRAEVKARDRARKTALRSTPEGRAKNIEAVQRWRERRRQQDALAQDKGTSFQRWWDKRYETAYQDCPRWFVRRHNPRAMGIPIAAVLDMILSRASKYRPVPIWQLESLVEKFCARHAYNYWYRIHGRFCVEYQQAHYGKGWKTFGLFQGRPVHFCEFCARELALTTLFCDTPTCNEVRAAIFINQEEGRWGIRARWSRSRDPIEALINYTRRHAYEIQSIQTGDSSSYERGDPQHVV